MRIDGDDEVTPGEYRHYKGGKYEVIAVGKHSESLEEMVLYKSLDHGSYWCRPMSEWKKPIDGQPGAKRFRSFSREFIYCDDSEWGRTLLELFVKLEKDILANVPLKQDKMPHDRAVQRIEVADYFTFQVPVVFSEAPPRFAESRDKLIEILKKKAESGYSLISSMRVLPADDAFKQLKGYVVYFDITKVL